jgi:hypothetical protein
MGLPEVDEIHFNMRREGVVVIGNGHSNSKHHLQFLSENNRPRYQNICSLILLTKAVNHPLRYVNLTLAGDDTDQGTFIMIVKVIWFVGTTNLWDFCKQSKRHKLDTIVNIRLHNHRLVVSDS